MAGVCTTFKHMAEYQEKNKIENGQEFVSRFIMAESERFGWSPNQMVEFCNNSIAIYYKTFEELGE